MKKRSTGSDEVNQLRQVVVEQPKKMVKNKEMMSMGKEEKEKSNKSSILDADGVRRRGGTAASAVGTDMMDEIDDIMRDDGGSTLGDKVIMFVKFRSSNIFTKTKGEEAVEATIEFGREGVWWGCCCRDLNRC